MTRLATPSMSSAAGEKLDRFMSGLIKRNPGEPEFHQAVQEVAESVIPYVLEHPKYDEAQIL